MKLFSIFFLLLLSCSIKGNKSEIVKGLFQENNRSEFSYVFSSYTDSLRVVFNKTDIVNYDGYSNEDSLCTYPKIIFNQNQIFIDEDRYFYSFKSSNIFCVKDITGNLYIVLTREDTFRDYYVIFDVKGKMIEVPLGSQKYFEDVDDDGLIEVGGYIIPEGYCTNCDSAFYSPTILYELSPGMHLDSVATKKETLKRFKEFHGCKVKDEPVPINR